jgi:exopolyphosphatase/guanosine-5'-triphosphate,3'-diphosphate pyrophosphatase
MLETCSYQDRINLLNLNEDRADVIVPATKIYLSALEAARVKEIIVPDAGLKDGILLYLFEKNLKNGKYQFSPDNSNLKT